MVIHDCTAFCSVYVVGLLQESDRGILKNITGFTAYVLCTMYYVYIAYFIAYFIAYLLHTYVLRVYCVFCCILMYCVCFANFIAYEVYRWRVPEAAIYMYMHDICM